jgi:1,2-diacylglycerol 3-beta-galactosyltransferase
MMMETSLSEQPRILFLFSDTGGGHRSASEAVIEALNEEFDGRVTTDMVDIFKDYAPRPLNYMPQLYPRMVRVPEAWGLGYRLSNGRRRARLITGGAWPYVRNAIRTLVAEHASDLIVSVHPLATAPTLRALGNQRPPVVTIVTDLVTTHALWYDRRTDLCIVPTEAARQRAIKYGLRDEQIALVGLPVAQRFCHPPGDRNALRAQLGWPQDSPVVLLVGGGDGMGPIERTAHTIAEANLAVAGKGNATAKNSVALVVVAGRNQSLKERLEAYPWPIPTYIYGFVREMPIFMRAADVLVTKAGPGTISEALIAELPMILYSRLPGQEDGNVTYVESEGAGRWAPRPEQIVSVLREWIEYPERRALAVTACRRLARPQAAHQIAHLLAEWVSISQERKRILL